MKKTYKSKIGPGILLFLALMLGCSCAIMIINRIWVGLAINLAVILMIAYVFTSITYVIENRTLIISSAFVKKTIIHIDEITRIAETNNLISAPAASLDRLEISYGTNKSVIISPVDKSSFIAELTLLNPKIEAVKKR